jgi:hypothetical protein
MHNLELPALALGPGYMDLQIDALNLMPGRYYLSAGITTIDGPIHDTVENCASLDIEPGLIFGSSRITDTRYGFVFFPQRWHLDGVRALGKS